MTKTKKYSKLAKDKVRVATYLPKNVKDLLTEEADRVGVSESTFIRQMLFERFMPAITNNS